MRGLMRTALWTELRRALEQDFPDVQFPHTAPENLSKVIKDNADFMFELSEKDTPTPSDGLTPTT